MKMDLNEALDRLKNAGFLTESVNIDFRKLNRLESEQRKAEIKNKFQALTDELEEKLFSNMGASPRIYLLDRYPFYNNKFTIVYEFKNLPAICVNENWNVNIDEKWFNTSNQSEAVQAILDNVK